MITPGGRFGGYGFYVLKNKPVFAVESGGLEAHQVGGAETLTPGPHVLEFDFKYDGLGAGTHGVQELQRRRSGRHGHAEGGRQGG